MSIPQAAIVGIGESRIGKVPDRSALQLQADAAQAALADAGLRMADIDGLLTTPVRVEHWNMPCGVVAHHLGIHPSYLATVDLAGASGAAMIHQAALAIGSGQCSTVLCVAGQNLLSHGSRAKAVKSMAEGGSAHPQFEVPYGPLVPSLYALVAQRHMHEYGTTSEQLAWIKVAASHHAQHNPHAMLREVVTVKEVLDSPVIADPLHRLDCCVVSDGGGALIVARPEIAKSLKRPLVKLIGAGEAPKGQAGGRLTLTTSGAAWSGAAAFAEAGVKPADIQYVSIYDSFTITVLVQIEDLGFCKKGEGGRFVANGNLISGSGKLPFNTDGGGLCNNHPANRGGMTKVIEAVRQLRGEAQPQVQVKNCGLALAQGTGGQLGTRHGSATLILERA